MYAMLDIDVTIRDVIHILCPKFGFIQYLYIYESTVHLYTYSISIKISLFICSTWVNYLKICLSNYLSDKPMKSYVVDRLYAVEKNLIYLRGMSPVNEKQDKNMCQ